MKKIKQFFKKNFAFSRSDDSNPFDNNFKIYRNWFLLSVCIVCSLPIVFTKLSIISLNVEKDGEIGDTLGGTMGPFIAIIGAALTFLAFWIQYKANEQQRSDIRNERFETRFLEMVSIHKSNVEELKFSYRVKNTEKGKDKFELQTDERRKVFKAIYSQYKELYKELDWLFSVEPDKIYNKSYQSLLEANTEIANRNIKLVNLARIDFSYLIVFFGLGMEDKITIKTLLTNYYQKDFIDRVLSFSAMKPLKFTSEWASWNKIIELENFYEINWFKHILSERIKEEKIDFPNYWEMQDRINAQDYRYADDYVKYYGGHQHRLGHYFRHYFQVIQFIDRANGLDYQEKYSYAKLLRAQLSNYEQVIFCLNSLSQIGRAWELEDKKKENLPYVINRRYITKYNLIKNIPSQKTIPGVDLGIYYPNVDYEAFNIPLSKSRIELEKEYT